MIDSGFKEIKPYPKDFLEKIREKIKDLFEVCGVRGF
jgi:hypothetical protein